MWVQRRGQQLDPAPKTKPSHTLLWCKRMNLLQFSEFFQRRIFPPNSKIKYFSSCLKKHAVKNEKQLARSMLMHQKYSRQLLGITGKGISWHHWQPTGALRWCPKFLSSFITVRGMLHLCFSSLPSLHRSPPKPTEDVWGTGGRMAAHLDVDPGSKSAALVLKSLAKTSTALPIVVLVTPLQVQTLISAGRIMHMPVCLCCMRGKTLWKIMKGCNGVSLDEMKMQNFLFIFVNEWTEKMSLLSLVHAELLQTFEENTDNLYFHSF